MSLNFCSNIQMVGSEFGVKNMKHGLSCLVSTVQAGGGGDIFLAYVGPFSTNGASYQ